MPDRKNNRATTLDQFRREQGVGSAMLRRLPPTFPAPFGAVRQKRVAAFSSCPHDAAFSGGPRHDSAD
jgi:hypothetical protein